MRIFLTIVFFVASIGQATAGEPWVLVSGGYGNYGLDSVTDAPTTYRGYSLEPGSLSSGSLLSASVGIEFEKPWSVGVAYERGNASTSGSSVDSYVEANIPLQSVKVTPCWFPFSRSSFRVGVGAGLGVGFVKGTASAAGGFYDSLDGDVDAVNLLMEGCVVSEYRPMPNFVIHGVLGMREISFDEFFVGGIPLKRDDTGEVVEFDYGGWYIQLGLKWMLPKSEIGI